MFIGMNHNHRHRGIGHSKRVTQKDYTEDMFQGVRRDGRSRRRRGRVDDNDVLRKDRVNECPT